MNCCISGLVLTCIENKYIQIAGITKGNERILFNGIHIVNGGRNYYIKSPYTVIRRGVNFRLIGADGFEFSFSISQTTSNVDQLLELLSACSCCKGEISQNSWVASGDEFETSPVTVPEDVSRVLIFRNGVYVPTEAQGGDYWRRESETEIEFTPSGTVEAGEFLSIILL